MLAAIPSPSRNVIEIGPLDIRVYGIMIALGVIAAVLFAGWRMRQRGMNSEIAVSLAWVAVPAGLIGARIYHVITDWRKFSERSRLGRCGENLGGRPRDSRRDHRRRAGWGCGVPNARLVSG